MPLPSPPPAPLHATPTSCRPSPRPRSSRRLPSPGAGETVECRVHGACRRQVPVHLHLPGTLPGRHGGSTHRRVTAARSYEPRGGGIRDSGRRPLCPRLRVWLPGASRRLVQRSASGRPAFGRWCGRHAQCCTVRLGETRFWRRHTKAVLHRFGDDRGALLGLGGKLSGERLVHRRRPRSRTSAGNARTASVAAWCSGTCAAMGSPDVDRPLQQDLLPEVPDLRQVLFRSSRATSVNR